jgi:hypothetical protein
MGDNQPLDVGPLRDKEWVWATPKGQVAVLLLGLFLSCFDLR